MSVQSTADRPTSAIGWRTPAVVVACGCLIAMISFGPRSSLGFFLTPLSQTNNWGRDVFALAVAIQNLLWGIGQPFAGAIADRFGTNRVLCVGALLYALGLVLCEVYTGKPAVTATTIEGGAAGLPVFTPIGLPGVARLIGPTGGYLLAYPLAAYAVGTLSSGRAGRAPGYLRLVVAALAGLVLIYLGGLVQLWVYAGNIRAAARFGTLPFLVGDLIKLGVAVLLLHLTIRPVRARL